LQRADLPGIRAKGLGERALPYEGEPKPFGFEEGGIGARQQGIGH